jgi:hypothetical protein
MASQQLTPATFGNAFKEQQVAILPDIYCTVVVITARFFLSG